MVTTTGLPDRIQQMQMRAGAAHLRRWNQKTDSVDFANPSTKPKRLSPYLRRALYEHYLGQVMYACSFIPASIAGVVNWKVKWVFRYPLLGIRIFRRGLFPAAVVKR